MWQHIAAMGITFTLTHVQVHQDEQWDWDNLSQLAQLNCKCNAMAKGYLKWAVVNGHRKAP